MDEGTRPGTGGTTGSEEEGGGESPGIRWRRTIGDGGIARTRAGPVPFPQLIGKTGEVGSADRQCQRRVKPGATPVEEDQLTV